MLSLPLTFLILLVALGSLAAAGVPLVLALTGVLATMAMVVIPSQIFPMDANVDALILLIGLAVGVDYSLFYMRREREERASGKSPRRCPDGGCGHLRARRADLGRDGHDRDVRDVHHRRGRRSSRSRSRRSPSSPSSCSSSLLVLPAVLAWLGDRVEKGRLPLRKRFSRPAGESRIWGSVVRGVMRRPLLSAVLAGGRAGRPGDSGAGDERRCRPAPTTSRRTWRS